MNEIRPRSPLLAMLLSLALPGLGQFYNGQLNRAIWLFLGFIAVLDPGIPVVAIHLPTAAMEPALLLGTVALLGLWSWGAVQAWREAKARSDHQPLAWQTSGAYAVVVVACAGMVVPAVTWQVHERMVAAYRIPSRSMEPGILSGDLLFADRSYNCPSCKHAIARGDVAIFTYPNDRTLTYIKRIIGLPGDRIRLSGRQLSVNGVALSAAGDGPAGNAPAVVTERTGNLQWQVRWEGPGPAAKDPREWTVPAGQVFVLGDNREASTDSRDFGTVPLSDVVGRARQVWFSRGPEGIRWSRLGLPVEPLKAASAVPAAAP